MSSMIFNYLTYYFPTSTDIKLAKAKIHSYNSHTRLGAQRSPKSPPTRSPGRHSLSLFSLLCSCLATLGHFSAALRRKFFGRFSPCVYSPMLLLAVAAFTYFIFTYTYTYMHAKILHRAIENFHRFSVRLVIVYRSTTATCTLCTVL